MPSANIDVAYRPIRIAFLVRRNSLEDVLTAVRLNSYIWGGMRNPILGVDDDLDRATKLVEQFKPDVLFAIEKDDVHLRAVRAAFPFLKWPPDISMHGLLQLAGNNSFSVVDIRLMVSHYYETFVRSSQGESRAVWPNWSINDPLAPLLATSFGDYGTADPAGRYRRAFLALGADELRVEGEIPSETLDKISPIVFTSDRLTRAGRYPDHHGLVLGDPTDAETLAAFWNLRSIGNSVVFWPEADPTRFSAYALEHLRRVIPEPMPDGEIVGPTLWRHEWPDPEHRELPEEIQAVYDEVEAHPLLAAFSDLTWSQPLERPGVWGTHSRRVLVSVEDDTWGRRQMAFPLPAHPYEASVMQDDWYAHWIVTLSVLSEYENPGYTLRIPSLPDLNDWVSHRLAPIDVRLNSGEVGVFSRPHETSLRLALVEELEVVQQVVGRAGITAQTSPAGEAVNRIIRQMGGLRGCRPFRLPGIRKLLARSPGTDRWEIAMETIQDKGSYSRYTNTNGTPAAMFARLLERGVFRAELKMQCPACRIRSGYPPESLATDVKCPRCGTDFLLAARLHDTHWEYRASGFFAHHREHGALPVILTMLRLEGDLEERALFLVPSQTLSGDDVNCESDFVAVHQRHDGDVVVALGECKGGPKKITQQSVDKLKAAADRIRESGLECYLVFATTRESFDDDEIGILRAYRESVQDQWSLDERMQGWRRPAPIVLTWRELRTYERSYRNFQDQLPEPYAMSLRGLAANSAFIYLDEHDEPLAHEDDEALHI